MKVAALISGGKDSCYNMMYCIANGHEIIALANLQPLKQQEIDSYMYQTVGQEVVHLYGQAMNIPFYYEFITGSSIDKSLNYCRTLNDETEDLHRLLKRIQNLHPDLEAVSVGAILSNYQRTRVENKSKRFTRRNDIPKLTCYYNKRLNKSHLGKSLVEIKDYLLEMNKRYNLNICGEGGEYESLVLDCPIFQKKIKILKSQIVNHSSDDVAYFNFVAKLEEKSFINTKWKEKFILPQELNEKYKQLKKIIDDDYKNREYKQNYIIPIISIKKNINNKLFMTFSNLKNLVAIGEISAYLNSIDSKTYTLEEEFHCCMNKLKDNLRKYSLELSNIIFVELIFKKKEHISHIDALYNQYFNFPKPPSRIYINCNNLKFNRLQISILADSSDKKRSVVYVHSRNYWIPANIGFYSHALIFENMIFTSGQTGLIPSTMCLPYPKSFSSEVVISLQNLERIFENIKIFSILCIAFISNEYYVLLTNEIWKHSFLYNNDCLIILVNSLSSEALIEWNIIGKKECENSYDGIIKSNLWSISFFTYKISEDSELSLEAILGTLLHSFEEKFTNGKILSSTIYYNSKSFEKVKSPETISKAISDTIQSLLGYRIESHCISTNGIWISGETITPPITVL
ncbi:unnamed protein product [Pneumocystis jirovecii]|uniref:Diphthine--ammonia ligase n=1 Tax=Pneumocystis jirovecii TaxID=42068 RepID=L0PCM9_PNEJI|nr:unnamed protein product [Pneumocystis jirovecii]